MNQPSGKQQDRSESGHVDACASTSFPASPPPAVVLPKAMAYATVAGLSVAVGLYTCFMPMVIYALLGSSRVLSVSSTTTLGILTGAELAHRRPDGDPAKLVIATATLTALVGAMLLLARLLRLGFVANFISTPVLTGFKAESAA